MENQEIQYTEYQKKMQQNPFLLDLDNIIETLDTEHEKSIPTTSRQNALVLYLESRGETIKYPKYTATTYNLLPKRLILFGILTIASIPLIVYVSVFAVLITLAIAVLGGFSIMEKELIYFDEEKIVDFRSTDLLKKEFKRKEYIHSECGQVDLSFYFFRKKRQSLWRFYMKDGSTFKIRVTCIFNGTFITGLTLKLHELGILNIE